MLSKIISLLGNRLLLLAQKFQVRNKYLKFIGYVFLCWIVGFIFFTEVIFKELQKKIKMSKVLVQTEATVKNKYRGFDKTSFVDFKKYAQNVKSDVRTIALYLPQFHQFEENNRWHGRGFTEWTNVTAAKPLYEGHYQPKLPIDVGFYDLTHDDVMKRQIELAKNYGISGFAFYYYWFSGHKLMEKPIYNYLNNKDLDLPFCLHWANENWSKRWDGGNRELLMEQKLTEADFEKFAEDILPFFLDKRYIRIDDKPLFIIYRPALFGQEMMLKFTTYLRQYVQKHGIKDLYLVGTKQFIFWNDPKDYGLDAVMDFSIRTAKAPRMKQVQKIYENSKFEVIDWKHYVQSGKMKADYKYKTFRTVFPRWDNSARKAFTGAIIFEDSTPDIYGQWLKYAYDMTKRDFQGEERILFINAWNEWAEGAMLEPDWKYGYAYLDMTRQVMDHTVEFSAEKIKPVGIAALTGGSNRIAKAIELLNDGVGEKLLISGVMPGVNFGILQGREDIVPTDEKVVELGYTARDTVGNAQEVYDWVRKYNMDEIYVVTSFYHIPRSRLELQHKMPKLKMNFVAVSSDFIAKKWWMSYKSLSFLAREYSKYLVVLLKYLPYNLISFFRG